MMQNRSSPRSGTSPNFADVANKKPSDLPTSASEKEEENLLLYIVRTDFSKKQETAAMDDQKSSLFQEIKKFFPYPPQNRIDKNENSYLFWALEKKTDFAFPDGYSFVEHHVSINQTQRSSPENKKNKCYFHYTLCLQKEEKLLKTHVYFYFSKNETLSFVGDHHLRFWLLGFKTEAPKPADFVWNEGLDLLFQQFPQLNMIVRSLYRYLKLCLSDHQNKIDVLCSALSECNQDQKSFEFAQSHNLNLEALEKCLVHPLTNTQQQGKIKYYLELYSTNLKCVSPIKDQKERSDDFLCLDECSPRDPACLNNNPSPKTKKQQKSTKEQRDREKEKVKNTEEQMILNKLSQYSEVLNKIQYLKNKKLNLEELAQCISEFNQLKNNLDPKGDLGLQLGPYKEIIHKFICGFLILCRSENFFSQDLQLSIREWIETYIDEIFFIMFERKPLKHTQIGLKKQFSFLKNIYFFSRVIEKPDLLEQQIQIKKKSDQPDLVAQYYQILQSILRAMPPQKNVLSSSDDLKKIEKDLNEAKSLLKEYPIDKRLDFLFFLIENYQVENEASSSALTISLPANNENISDKAQDLRPLKSCLEIVSRYFHLTLKRFLRRDPDESEEQKQPKDWFEEQKQDKNSPLYQNLSDHLETLSDEFFYFVRNYDSVSSDQDRAHVLRLKKMKVIESLYRDSIEFIQSFTKCDSIIACYKTLDVLLKKIQDYRIFAYYCICLNMYFLPPSVKADHSDRAQLSQYYQNGCFHNEKFFSDFNSLIIQGIQHLYRYWIFELFLAQKIHYDANTELAEKNHKLNVLEELAEGIEKKISHLFDEVKTEYQFSSGGTCNVLLFDQYSKTYYSLLESLLGSIFYCQYEILYTDSLTGQKKNIADYKPVDYKNDPFYAQNFKMPFEDVNEKTPLLKITSVLKQIEEIQVPQDVEQHQQQHLDCLKPMIFSVVPQEASMKKEQASKQPTLVSEKLRPS